VVDVPVTLVGHIGAVDLDLPVAFDEDKGFPIHLSGALSDPERRFTGVKLCYKKTTDPSYTEVPLYVDVDSGYEYDNTIWLEDVIGSAAVAALEGTTYNFKFAVSCNDGSTSYSDVTSVEVARFNYQPNPYPKWKSGGVIYSDTEHPWNLIDPDTGENWWTENNFANANEWWEAHGSGSSLNGLANAGVSNQVWTTWKNGFSDVDWDRGDRLEAFADLSDCFFIKTGSSYNNNNDVGLGEVLGLGKLELNDNGQARNNEVHYYGPSRRDSIAEDDPRQFNLQLNYVPNWPKKWLGQYYGDAIFVLSKNLLTLNGVSTLDYSGEVENNWSDSSYNTILANITSGTTIWVGSVEGQHRTRAKYNFVRMIRFCEISE
ncbi:MAG: hypothetical protein K5909_00375, partial [Bacteroidales bacterium]|nr:hypothetical protein [Bacteroidales bacterium]